MCGQATAKAMVMWKVATTVRTLLCFYLTITLATSFLFDIEEESVSDEDTHHVACVQGWRLEGTCTVGPWLECPPDPNRHRRRAEENGYTTFTVEGGEVHVKRYNVSSTLDEALKTCRTDGATLIKIDTAEKQDIVSHLFHTAEKQGIFRHLFHAMDTRNKPNHWIGLRCMARSNVYRWTDGSEATYKNWMKGEPDGGNEDCVALTLMLSGELKWSDHSCNVLRAFICEM